MTISTRDLSGLPDVEGLQRLLQSLAMLEAILCPDWQYRYYSFNAGWADGAQMCSMRDGSGDDFFVLFDSAGCFLKGFAHESPMSPYRKNPKKIWPGVIDHVPPAFVGGLEEPAFSMQDVTFCIWRGPGDNSWQVGPIHWPDDPDPDGSAKLLSPLDGDPATYHAWAERYYQRQIDLASVQQIYAHELLSEVLVAGLNPEVTLEDLEADIEEIGYPR